MNGENEDFYYGEPMDGGGFAHILKLGGHEVIVLHRRKIYTPYNETPTIKDRFMNPQTAKKLLKIVVFVTSAAAYGLIHKADVAANDKIDERYSEPTDESKDDTEL